TILLVSHDRYLINALATQIWALGPGELTVYEGTYQEYVAWRDRPPAEPEAGNGARQPTAPADTGTRKHGLNPYQLQRRLEELEAQIHSFELELAALTEAIGTASAEGNGDRVRALGERYSRAEADLHAVMETWSA